MKMKKNVATAIVSGALVGCLAIGGTLAYLTANSGTLTNKFTGASNLNVTISETATDSTNDTYKVDGAHETGEKASGETGGLTYKDVVPGAQVSKDVDVHVKQNDSGVKSYVFIRITGLDNDKLDATALQTATANGGTWVKVDGDDTKQDGIYALTENGSLDNLKAIDSSEGDVTLNVFDTINVKTDLKENISELGEIIVTAQTVQANGVDSATAIAQVTSDLF